MAAVLSLGGAFAMEEVLLSLSKTLRVIAAVCLGGLFEMAAVYTLDGAFAMVALLYLDGGLTMK